MSLNPEKTVQIASISAEKKSKSTQRLQLMMTHAKSKFESKIIDSLQLGQLSSLYSYIPGQNNIMIPPVVNSWIPLKLWGVMVLVQSF